MGTPQGVPQLHTAGFGVTEAALDVFSNFVTHIAENALPTGAVSENLQPSPKQLRRSRRFAPTAEAPDTCPLALPAPLVQKVRFAASVSCCDGRQLGFCGGIHGYRLKPGTAIGSVRSAVIHPSGPLFPRRWTSRPPCRCWFGCLQCRGATANDLVLLRRCCDGDCGNWVHSRSSQIAHARLRPPFPFVSTPWDSCVSTLWDFAATEFFPLLPPALAAHKLAIAPGGRSEVGHTCVGSIAAVANACEGQIAKRVGLLGAQFLNLVGGAPCRCEERRLYPGELRESGCQGVADQG